MMIRKADIKAPPILPREEVEVTELGGTVIVQGMGLTDRLAIATVDRAKPRHISQMLACCVLAKGDEIDGQEIDDEPLFTEAEWESWGAQHIEAAMRLVDVALRLSGYYGQATEKN
jgi:hypothetical protein